MGLIRFDGDSDHVVSAAYSVGRGPVLRSDNLELVRIQFRKGEQAVPHSHPEEQIFYIVSGRAQMTLGDERYVVEAGQASYNPGDVVHSLEALEDLVAISVKHLVAPIYEETGRLS